MITMSGVPRCVHGRLWLATALWGATLGCSHQQTAEEALDASLATLGTSKVAVSPLAGTVTIDGHPPQLERRQKILVMLHDPAKGGKSPKDPPFVVCNAQGGFAFHTYHDRDGVPPGEYVLTFVQLTDRGKRGYLGPDGLKNLYNDPDKSEIKIAHAGAGRTDYAFDLKIEGRDAIKPSPRAVLNLQDLTTR
jgi:hypothetical protein